MNSGSVGAAGRSWILEKWSFDALVIFLPGLVGIGIGYTVAGDSPGYWIWAVIVLACVDSGHVYSTLWRTYIDPAERRSHPIYWVAPLLSVAGVTAWLLAQLPHLWSFIVYATLWHHVRQFYGYCRWYQRLNGRDCRPSGWFVYGLTALPILLFHVKPGAPAFAYYEAAELFSFPSSALFRSGLVLYSGLVVSWIVFEIRLWRTGRWEPNRFLSIATPAVLYGYCTLMGTNGVQVMGPLILAHGVSYYGVISLSVKRQYRPRVPTLGTAALLVVVPTCLLGAGEFYLESAVLPLDNHYVGARPSILQALIVGLYLVPLSCHYVLDAFIWTGRHRLARTVMLPQDAVDLSRN